MWKSIGVFLVLTTCIICPPTSNGKLVDEKSWANFLDDLHSGAAGSAADAIDNNDDYDNCRIRVTCEALRRVTVSCDSVIASVGCGECQGGFRAASDGKCVPKLSSGKPDSSKLDTSDRLIDSLRAADDAKKNSAPESLRLRSLEEEEEVDDDALPPEAFSTTNDSLGAPAPAPPPAHPPGHSPPASRAPTNNGDWAFYMIIGITCGLGLLLIVICSICWYKYNFASKQADKDFANTEYIRSASGSAGDGKLALSAQMYHYQHQKQQMLAMERSNSDLQRDLSDDDSDLENDEADFTVYECPGLAPTKEMEVRNPLFKEDVEPTSTAGAPQQQSASNSGSAAHAARK